jgi:hypothetical protein
MSELTELKKRLSKLSPSDLIKFQKMVGAAWRKGLGKKILGEKSGGKINKKKK